MGDRQMYREEVRSRRHAITDTARWKPLRILATHVKAFSELCFCEAVILNGLCSTAVTPGASYLLSSYCSSVCLASLAFARHSGQKRR